MIRLLLLIIGICWGLALLGVAPLQAFGRDYGIPVTLAEVLQAAGVAWAWLDATLTAHPVIGLVVLPGAALVALLWR